MSVEIFKNHNLELNVSILIGAEKQIENNIPQEIVNQAGQVIAEYIIKNHLPEILSKIDPQAIANIAIAKAGAEINKTLKEKLPDTVLHIHEKEIETQVFKKTLFGNLKRL